MASVKFFIKGNKNPSTVFVRFLNGRKTDYTKSTSLLVNPGEWNKAKGIVRNNKNLALNNLLNTLRLHIVNDFNECYFNGLQIGKTWLSESLDNFKKSNKRIITVLNIDAKSIDEVSSEFDFTLNKFNAFKPSIYFLLNKGEVVYVGKTINVGNRIASHLSEGSKLFEDIYFIDVLEKQLDELEQQFIGFYKPKYNIQFNN
jgi:hypothetical protein